MAEEKKDIWTRLVETWWACVLAGLVVWVLTYFQYQDLARLEAGELDVMYVKSSTKFFYETGGKPLVAGIGGLIGLFLIGYGVYIGFIDKARPAK